MIFQIQKSNYPNWNPAIFLFEKSALSLLIRQDSGAINILSHLDLHLTEFKQQSKMQFIG